MSFKCNLDSHIHALIMAKRQNFTLIISKNNEINISALIWKKKQRSIIKTGSIPKTFKMCA
jgi:hypothetical protein